MIAIQAAVKAPALGLVEGRILHLVDVENLVGSAVENLVGSADFTRGEAAHTYAWFGWPASARRLVRSGADGADLALLGVLDRESVAERFDVVVIGSGDGIFALAAARLQRAGLTVTVVTRRDGLSRQLRLAVRDIRFIDLEPPSPSVAVARAA